MSKQLTVDEILDHVEPGWCGNPFCEIPNISMDEAKTQLSQLITEIIGEYNTFQDAYGIHEAENNLIEEQRTRARERGFVVEEK